MFYSLKFKPKHYKESMGVGNIKTITVQPVVSKIQLLFLDSLLFKPKHCKESMGIGNI